MFDKLASCDIILTKELYNQKTPVALYNLSIIERTLVQKCTEIEEEFWQSQYCIF